MNRNTCPECGAPLPAAQPTGRPATYCSTACRRAGEYALRRAQVLLTRAQRAEQDAALRMAMADGWDRKDHERRLTFWRTEIDRLRVSMRELLGTVDGDAPLMAPTPPAA